MTEQPKIAAFKGANNTEYLQAPWSGKNTAGFKPIGAEIMVLMDRSVAKTTGGIIVAETYQDRMNVSAETGVVVALGFAAFADYPEGERPKPGDRVVVEKFAGREFAGRDGQVYRIMTYTCVGGIELAEDAPKQKRRK